MDIYKSWLIFQFKKLYYVTPNMFLIMPTLSETSEYLYPQGI